MNAALADRIVQEHAAARDGLPSSVVSAERRRGAVEVLAAKGLPTPRDDNWKYANLRPVERVAFSPVAPGASATITPTDLPPAIGTYARYVFVDGAFVAHLSATGTPAGVTVKSSALSGAPVTGAAAQCGGSAARGDTLIDTQHADGRFALLNDAFATDGARIQAPQGAECTACVEILFLATQPAQSAASYPRLELNVEANARIGLIERHLSAHSDANFVNGSVQVSIGAGAQVDHYRLQHAGSHATWIDTLTATVAKDARYTVHAVNIGGLSARSTVRVRLTGERAETSLYVVSLADGQQVHDSFALIEHVAPNTKSEQSVRSIAAGRARVAFNSKVVVRERAKGTDSRQSLRGLLAGAQAEIDMRPQLEIYTDDVRCGHGATAGKLDDNMLFYMLSRGIERDTAQQLLKWAFLEDVVSRIAVPELRKQVEQSLAGQMKETAALKELL